MPELVGHIGVDAGCVMVGDPCYTQGEDASSHVASWDEFLEKTWPNVFGPDSQGSNAPMADATYALGEKHLGVVVSSGFGDGTYPVYIERDPASGRVASVTVVFIGDENDEELDLEDEDESLFA